MVSMRPPDIIFEDDNTLTRSVRLVGEVGADDFGPWMARHARKLGVEIEIGLQTPHEIKVLTKGAPEMVDAFALAASLGPKSVIVDTMEILGEDGTDVGG